MADSICNFFLVNTILFGTKKDLEKVRCGRRAIRAAAATGKTTAGTPSREARGGVPRYSPPFS